MGYYPGPNYALDDFNLRDRLSEIVKEHNIQCVVETGLNDGQSTREFCRMLVPRVIGIDHDPKCIEATRTLLDASGWMNYELLLGHSPDKLREIMPTLPNETIFFIDAHWDGECPTLDEIKAIPEGKGILVFHDFFVPGKSSRDTTVQEFGWDHLIINGVHRANDYELIRDDLTRWSPSHRLEYAKVVSGSKRGFCFVYPS